MEEKVLFDVVTAWQFPVVKYTTNTAYVTVKKASGIAYILLQLIVNSENNSEKIVVTLMNIGVPKDIHYIFAGEIANMISYGILKMKSGRDYSSELIDRYVISDFEITNLGKKLFAEGRIPTGNKNTKRVDVYYDVSRKETNNTHEGKVFLLSETVLDENCVGDILLNNSDIEMYVSNNMEKFSFKKGERISSFNHEKPTIYVYKLDDAVNIKITQRNIQIIAKDKERNSFIHKFYTGDTITRIMEMKKKYHFPESISKGISEYNYAELSNLVKLYMPSQFNTLTRIKTPLSISPYCDINGSECIINKSVALELMQKCDVEGVACYFENNDLFTIIPGRFLIDSENVRGKVALNLVAIQLLEDDTKQELLREIFFKCTESSDFAKCCEVIKRLAQISKVKDYTEQYSNHILKSLDSNTEKIDSFMKLNEAFSKTIDWNSFAKPEAEMLFKELCQKVTVENFVAQDILGKKLNKIMGYNDIAYLKEFTKNILENKSSIDVFEVIISAKYSTEVALNIVNIFEKYCTQILQGKRISGTGFLGVQCALVEQELSELKDLTGIVNPYEDAAKLNFDYDRFFQVMVTLADALKKIEKYKHFAMEKFSQIITLFERFEDLKKVVVIEQEASRHPENINKQYVELQLKKGRYKEVICDLHVRLQYELYKMFNTTNTPVFNLLSKPEINEYFTKDEVSVLHSLRQCRNDLQHPKGKRPIQYSADIIREWCACVEKLGGINRELCNED